MMNLRKTAEEINRLRQLVANQKDTIEKAMNVIDHLIAENMKLKDEKSKLIRGDYDACRDLVNHWKTHAVPAETSDLIFPNTDERGLGDGDTPTDLSPLDL